MTDTEAIEAVRRGERVSGEHSLHAEEKQVVCTIHQWRVLFCDSETDVVECAKCGWQKLARCTFDEEYA